MSSGPMEAVWLPVLPSFKGFGPALAKGAAADADKAGKGIGLSLGKSIVAGVAAGGAGLAAAGVALYKVGEVFDDVADTIRVGTGATGAALDGLVASAKNVGTKVPADFEKIGPVVADLNTRLGLSGSTLETVASQYLEAGRILGEDVDVTKTSAAFSAFKIEGDQVSGAMDHLFQVSQATGVGMNELAEAAARNAPAMEILGFSFEETTAMIGSFDKAGLNSSALMASMSKGMVTLAKDGEEPAAAFKRVQEEITGFVSAGDDAAALELASKVFGTKGAAQFIGAVKSGALNLEDMSKAAGQTGDTILGAGAETMDFAEQWMMFKNKILVWLEPMGARVFGALGTVMGEVTSGVTAFGAAWKYNDGDITSSGIPGMFERLGYFARQAFDYFNANVLPVLQQFGTYLVTNVLPVIQQFGAYLIDTVVPALASFGTWLKDNVYILGVVAAGVLAYVAAVRAMSIINTITTAMKGMTLAQLSLNAAFRANPIGLIVTALTLLVGGILYAYNNIGWFKDGVNAAFAGIQVAVGVVVSWFQTTVLPILSAIWSGIATGAQWLYTNVIQPVWAGIMTSVAAVVSWFQTTALPFISTALSTMGAVFSWLYESIIKPVWAGIQWYISTAWTVISGIFQVIVAIVRNVLAPVFVWLWNNVIAPVFTGISQIISAFWNGAVKPIFDAIGNFIRTTLGPAFTWFKDNVITPVWDFISQKISTIWNDNIRPVFDALKAGVDALPAAFEAAKSGIATAWDAIREAVKKPIRAVIGFINEGLIARFNDIPGVEIDPIALPPGFAHGGYTGDGRKYEAAGIVHKGEYVFTKEQTAALGKRRLAAMASAAVRGGAASMGEGNIGGFFEGNASAIRRHGAYYLDVAPGMGGWNFPGAARMWDGAAGVKVAVGRGSLQGRVTPLERGVGILGYTTGNNIDMSPSWMARLGARQRMTVAAHEIGHALGLPHNSSNSIMQPNLQNMASAPTSLDIRNLQRLFPGGSGKGGDGSVANPFEGLLDAMMAKLKAEFPGGGMFIDAAGGLAKTGIGQVMKIVEDIKNGLKDLAGNVFGKVKEFFGGGAATAPDAPLFRDQGGLLPPGLSTVLNATGGNEYVLNRRQWADISTLARRNGSGGETHNWNISAEPGLAHEYARSIAREGEQRRRDLVAAYGT